MNISLIGITNSFSNEYKTIDVLYTAISQCYNESFSIEECQNISYENKCKLIKNVIQSGHTSVLEHIQFTFQLDDISRCCSHQLVRHRIGCSYTQKSGRYTLVENDNYFVLPKSIKTEEEKTIYNSAMKQCKETYDKLISLGIPKEDARFCLPNAQKTNITVSMNCRSLQNFFSQRLCTRAQWEIREVATKMADICKKELPVIFEECKFGYPKCELDGFCKEHNSCGRKPTLK